MLSLAYSHIFYVLSASLNKTFPSYFPRVSYAPDNVGAYNT